MSGAIGKGATSLKKDTAQPSLIPQVGFKNTQFMHSASAGDTTIDLQALNVPAIATANGFVQPSGSDLAATNILQFKQNIRLESSVRTMTQFVDYVISGPQTIKLIVAAVEGEIFTGTISANPRSGSTILDASATPVTGVLPAGQTDFSTGPYAVGKNPGAQHGAFMVVVDNQIAYRNFGNEATGVGDYYELAGIIRFNTTDTVDRNVSLIPIGAIVEQPDGSQLAMVEAVNSKIDAVIPTVAALAGVPESNFGITPTNADLKAFGDLALDSKQRLDAIIEATANALGLVRKNKKQRKLLTSDVTSDGSVSDLQFNNLVVGKEYRVGGSVLFQKASGGGDNIDLQFAADSGSSIRYGQVTGQVDVGQVYRISPNIVFTATSTTMYCVAASIDAGSSIGGANNTAETYITLEELNNTEPTTDFT